MLDLDDNVRAGRRGEPSDPSVAAARIYPRRDPPATARFSRAIRADPSINITVRICQLMATLARRSGYASMSVDRMAEELGASEAAVAQARRKLVCLDLFTRETGWRYRIVGEKADFARRCVGDRRLDLTGRLIWLLDWLTERDGRALLSRTAAASYLGVADTNISPAKRRVLATGHFAVERTQRGDVFIRTSWVPAPSHEPEQDAEQPDFSAYKRRQRK